MKQSYLKSLLLGFSILLAIPTMASIEIDGIYYNLTGNGAEVTSNPSYYSGDINIPDIVSYKGATYSVTSIGREAFLNCTNLANIYIPISVTRINEYAFQNCINLTNIYIPISVTSIGRSAFEDCSHLQNVYLNEGLTTIDMYAFSDCSELTKVYIPSSVTKIGQSAFHGCNLDAVEVSDLDAYCKIEFGGQESPLQNNTKLLVNGKEPEGDLVIPNGVTIVAMNLFRNCTGLTSVTFPTGVTNIRSSAFHGCTGLTSIHLPAGLISIGNVAFGQCTGLTNITIPASVSNIEYQSFYGCSSLTSINVEEGNTEYDSRNNCNAIIKTSDGTLVKGCESTFIPQGVKTIGSYAFYSCAGLSAIDIPSSVSTIGEYNQEIEGETNVEIIPVSA